MFRPLRTGADDASQAGECCRFARVLSTALVPGIIGVLTVACIGLTVAIIWTVTTSSPPAVAYSSDNSSNEAATTKSVTIPPLPAAGEGKGVRGAADSNPNTDSLIDDAASPGSTPTSSEVARAETPATETPSADAAVKDTAALEKAFAKAIESASRTTAAAESEGPSPVVAIRPEPKATPRPVSDRPVSAPKRSEAELRDELRVGAANIRPAKKLLASLHRSSDADGERKSILDKQDELRGLPFRMGTECRTNEVAARVLGALSADFQAWKRRTFIQQKMQTRTMVFGSGATTASSVLDPTPDEDATPEQLRATAVAAMLDQGFWTKPDSVPAVEQMLQVEETPARLEMIAGLARFKTAPASTVLARRALFDLSPEVREAAVAELRGRPQSQYLDVLLSGFRHPWEQAAWNAAEALIALKTSDAYFELVCLLEESDPSAPFMNDEGNWSVRELVAVNHLRNCQLCHPRSSGTNDVVRGPVPVNGKPLPVQYYQSHEGEFVRADVTYLKQDFSLMQPVEFHEPWPEMQRFDYFVRERQLSALESPAPSLPDYKTAPPDYPQRDAVLFALRGISGIDAGTTSDKWRDALLTVKSVLVRTPG